MRKNGRTDANQSIIVRSLRDAGASVLILSSVGNGCPDILVAKNGRTVLMEIKDPTQKPADRKLTEDERVFHALWRGEIAVVETPCEALRLVGIL
jgi:Holliday junction resolvase